MGGFFGSKIIYWIQAADVDIYMQSTLFRLIHMLAVIVTALHTHTHNEPTPFY